MSDPIRDLDDVEAIAWFHAWCIARERENAACDTAAENADECVRLLRERRGLVPTASVVSLATRLAAGCGREVERAKIAAWLRAEHSRGRVSYPTDLLVEAIERGEHDR